jgi:excisionase family DNA binding protein
VREIMTDLPAKALLRPAKVADILDVSVSTIYYWIAIGKLEAIKLPGKTLRISRLAIEELQEHTTLS